MIGNGIHLNQIQSPKMKKAQSSEKTGQTYYPSRSIKTQNIITCCTVNTRRLQRVLKKQWLDDQAHSENAELKKKFGTLR